MVEKMKLIFLIILPIAIGISVCLSFFPAFEEISITFSIVLAVTIPFSVATYFSKKFLKNFEKNEKYIAALIFVHPKIKESFKFIFVACFIFGIFWTLSLIRRYVKWIEGIGFGIVFSTYLVLLSFIYFFKTLYDLTKSE
jgi:membrane-bound metal-dependent hydrolase YbcI (DUF457 family)